MSKQTKFWAVFPFVFIFVFTTVAYSQDRYESLGEISGGRCGAFKGDTLVWGVELKHKVSKDPTTGDYLYWYKLSNNGLETVFVSWENIDRILALGRAYPHIFTIEPKKFEEFTLKTSEAPINFRGRLSLFEYIDPKRMLAGSGFILDTTSKRALVDTFSCGQPGPLPSIAGKTLRP